MTGLQIALTVIAGSLLVLLAVILFAPIRVRAVIRNGDILLTASLLFFRKNLLSLREERTVLKDVAKCRVSLRTVRKEKRRWKRLLKKAEKKRLKKRQKAAQKRLEPKLNIIERLNLIRNVLQRSYEITRGKLNARFDRMHIRLATGDAAETAILYGAVLQSAVHLFEWIDKHFTRIDRKEGAMTIEPDYLARKSDIDVDLTLSTTVCVAIPGLIRLLTSYQQEKRLAKRTGTAPPVKHPETDSTGYSG